MLVCQNVARKECFYYSAVEELFFKYNVNFSFSLSAVNGSVYEKIGDICGMWCFSQFYVLCGMIVFYLVFILSVSVLTFYVICLLTNKHTY